MFWSLYEIGLVSVATVSCGVWVSPEMSHDATLLHTLIHILVPIVAFLCLDMAVC